MALIPCKHCKSFFEPDHKAKLYCSHKCRIKKHRFQSRFHGMGLSDGTVGAISELEVSVDLMKKNFHVFRALSPSACCDLLILKNGVLKSVEVRTGYENPNKKVVYPKPKNQVDYVAVTVGHRIVYFPELPS